MEYRDEIIPHWTTCEVWFRKNYIYPHVGDSILKLNLFPFVALCLILSVTPEKMYNVTNCTFCYNHEGQIDMSGHGLLLNTPFRPSVDYDPF